MSDTQNTVKKYRPGTGVEHPAYPDGATTDALVQWYAACPTGVPEHELHAAIPAAIDAVYAARDDGRMMHAAGAAAAVAALMAAQEVR